MKDEKRLTMYVRIDAKRRFPDGIWEVDIAIVKPKKDQHGVKYMHPYTYTYQFKSEFDVDKLEWLCKKGWFGQAVQFINKAKLSDPKGEQE